MKTPTQKAWAQIAEIFRRLEQQPKAPPKGKVKSDKNTPKAPKSLR